MVTADCTVHTRDVFAGIVSNSCSQWEISSSCYPLHGVWDKPERAAMLLDQVVGIPTFLANTLKANFIRGTAP